MKYLILILAVSVGLNILGGYLLFKPGKKPIPQKIFITNQNYLTNYIPVDSGDYSDVIQSYLDVIEQLNHYRTDPITITNSTNYARVQLYQRYAEIPLPICEKYTPPENLVGVSYSIGNTIFASYNRRIFTFKEVSLYGGVVMGLYEAKQPYFGVLGQINF